MLDFVRILAGVAWLAAMLYTFPSVYRTFVRKEDLRDKGWTFCFFFGLLQVGYFLRFGMGLAPEPDPGASYSMTLGLKVLSAMIALRIVDRRIELDGWRLWKR